MTRLWTEGEGLNLKVDLNGAPGAFRWRGSLHRVESVANQWRVDTQWWQGRIWRDYWKLVTDTGLLVVVYRDRVTDKWYLQRFYD